MRMLIALAGVAALAACAPSAEELEQAKKDAEAAQAQPVDPATLAPDGEPVYGTYEVTQDGRTVTQTLTDGGAVTVVENGEQTMTGLYTTPEPGKVCFSYTDESQSGCYMQSEVGEDGSWTSTHEDDPENAWTIRRQAAADADAATGDADAADTEDETDAS